MRERFPADAPLRSVVEHIAGRHPSLSSFSLLQGFPRKRFGEAELACSLRSLGLTPNAALCIQTTPPETPQDAQSPADPPPAPNQPPQQQQQPPPPYEPPLQPRLPLLEGPGRGPDPVIPPPLPNELWEEAANYAGIPGVGPGPSHFWGRVPTTWSKFYIYKQVLSWFTATRKRKVDALLKITVNYFQS